MNIPVIWLALLVGQAPAPPAAVVLLVKGEVRLERRGDSARKVEARDRLVPGDRLVVPKEGVAVVVALKTGTRERLKPGVEATVGPAGLTPTSALASRSALPGPVAETLRSAPPPPSGRAAVLILRGDKERRQGSRKVAPIPGSLVLNDRPDLAWPAFEGVATYRVRMTILGSGRELWVAESASPRLAYPADRPALTRDRSFSWTVTDPSGKTLVRSTFSTSSVEDVEAAGEIGRLAASDDPSDVQAALLAYESLGVLGEAVMAAERLVKVAPDDPSSHEALAALYEQTGREDDAARARARAAELSRGRRPG